MSGVDSSFGAVFGGKWCRVKRLTLLSPVHFGFTLNLSFLLGECFLVGDMGLSPPISIAVHCTSDLTLRVQHSIPGIKQGSEF